MNSLSLKQHLILNAFCGGNINPARELGHKNPELKIRTLRMIWSRVNGLDAMCGNARAMISAVQKSDGLPTTR